MYLEIWINIYKPTCCLFRTNSLALAFRTTKIYKERKKCFFNIVYFPNWPPLQSICPSLGNTTTGDTIDLKWDELTGSLSNIFIHSFIDLNGCNLRYFGV